MDEVGAELRQHHPESFRPVKVSCPNGEEKVFCAFTKVVRLKRYGRKCLVIVHEQEDLTELSLKVSRLGCLRAGRVSFAIRYT